MRQAVANLIDREELATKVYKDTYTPMYSYIPDGLVGHEDTFKTAYGDGNGKPSADKAKKVLEDAGVSTPVELKLQYNPDHYGSSSADEYAALKAQLEEGGLFKVDLQSTEWTSTTKTVLLPRILMDPTRSTSSAGSRITPTRITICPRSSVTATS